MNATRHKALLTLLIAAVACDPSPPPEPKPAAPQTTREAPAPPSPASLRNPLELRRESIVAPALHNLLTEHHLTHHPLDDATARVALERYVEQLDPSRMFLLQPHVAQLLAHAPQLDGQLREGRLRVMEDAHQLMRAQLTAVRAVVKRHLAQPLPMTSDGHLETDPTRLPWCAAEADREARWRLLLHGQVLERVLSLEESATLQAEATGLPAPDRDDPATLDAWEREARAALTEAYDAQFALTARRGHIKELEQLLTAVASAYDPHTAYLPPDRKEELDVQLSGTTEGIGVMLEKKGHHVAVAWLVPGSTGWRQGVLEVGDVLLMVAEGDGEPVTLLNTPIDEATALLRGERGTEVTLTVRKDSGRVVTVRVRRDTVVLVETYARGALIQTTPRGPWIGYIDLPRFYGDARGGGAEPGGRRSSDDVAALLNASPQEEPAALILDLRGNGGGFLDDARRIAGFFIDQGPIGQLHHADGTQAVLRDDEAGALSSKRLLVLVDGDTHSSAEVLAAALKDHARALIVGPGQTYGKGTAQIVVNLDDYVDAPGLDALRPLGYVKLTNQRIFRVTGASTQRRGVQPHVTLSTGAAPRGERDLPGALAWSSAPPLTTSPWDKHAWEIDALRARSLARQKRDRVLIDLKRRAELLRDEPTRVPLDLKAMRERLVERRRQLAALAAPQRGQARLRVKPLGHAAPKAAPDHGLERWTEEVQHDPWLAEATRVLMDALK